MDAWHSDRVDHYFAKMRGTASRLDDEAVEKFKASLKLVDGRVAHAEYGMLEPHMAKTEIKALLLHLGITEEEFALGDQKLCWFGLKECHDTPANYCNDYICRGH